ncbi:MAG: fasciclin domain-containing protein [Sphingobacteriaceae bacterium]|nr:fasciclin domain-containing protein [Sphingobacteriaceae bacterium]
MKKKLTNSHKAYAFMFILMIIALNACKKPDYTLTTTEDVNITGYLAKYPEKFSLMSEIITKSGSEGFLGAYGSYTLFTPTNDAIKAWLQSINKSSLSELSSEELKKVINYHLVMDTLNTKNFTDGKLQRLPLYNQYITTGVSNINGVSTYTLNKESRIIQSNIRVGNGVLQVIDHVLVPRTKTLAQLIAENDRYDIFEEALIATKFFDSLNVDPLVSTDALKRFQTVIAVSDSAFEKDNIFNFEDLKDRLSTENDPTKKTDSLWLFMAYHITPSANYLADVASSTSLVTLAPSEILTAKYAGQKVLLNEVEFNGAIEPGIELNRVFSDVSASNGVLHDAKNYFTIKVRFPTPLYWDMELDGLSQNPRNPDYGVRAINLHPNGASFNPASYLPADATKIGSQYQVGSPGNRVFNKGDLLNLSLSGPTSNLARPLHHDFRTPLLVKGLYKVWVCYGQNGNANANQTQWVMNPGTPAEQVLPNIMISGNNLGSSGISLTAPNSDNLMEANGFKRYMALNTETAVNAQGQIVTGDAAYVLGTNTTVGRLVGIANIKTTDRHWIRIRGLGGMSGSNIIWLDMIHFIPIDMDQQYPRFSSKGVVFKRPAP